MTKTTNQFEPLSERYVDIILDGGRNTGSFVEGLRHDLLMLDDYDTIIQFCKFLDEEVGGCGPINIQPLWEAFNKPYSDYSYMTIELWKEKFEKIKQIEKDLTI